MSAGTVAAVRKLAAKRGGPISRTAEYLLKLGLAEHSRAKK